MTKHLWMLWMVGFASVSMAQTATGVEASENATTKAERTLIRSGRAGANARYAAAERACYQKFAVSRCLEDAKLDRRETLRDLSRRERVLNQQERQDKSTARLSAIEKKSAANKAKGEQSGADTAGANRPGRIRAVKPDTGDGTGAIQIRQRSKASAGSPAEAASAAARQEKKNQQAQQRRVKRDTKLKARTKLPSATLPVPE